ncbi:LURP-one-like protein [Actinidia rufa]|uniref:LURP-one-like protein n=1 Tax=Actinidia rufa TaxID=165716 RepID=A0A7J0E7L1_9ERIC|nr:LURP-one-like protein [Actinidia rufa]
MPSPSCPPLVTPLAVIGPQFCAPYPVDLAVVRKLLKITEGNLAVTDVNGNFQIKGKFFSLRDRRVLLDASGNPILTFQQKMHKKHSVQSIVLGKDMFMATMYPNVDYAFIVARGGPQYYLPHPVDLAIVRKVMALTEDKDCTADGNEQHNGGGCDFKADGSWLELSRVIYAGESSTIVAQMHKKHTAESILLGKDWFMVAVYPQIDYAFIDALLVIIDDIKKEDGFN